MPRDSTGKYTLPAGNPVVADTEILANWANTTLPDIGNALSQSLPRDGGIPMLGPLYLARDAISPKEAVTKQQFDAAVANEGNFIPAGAIQWFAMNTTTPTGWLVCDGTPVSKETYNDLWLAIQDIYLPAGKSPDPVNFYLPDLRGMFLRGWDGARGKDSGRVFGSDQTDSNKTHTHGVTDNGHAHTVDVNDFTPTIKDTHQHNSGVGDTTVGSGSNEAATIRGAGTGAIPTNGKTGEITAATVTGLGGNTSSNSTGISVNNDTSTPVDAHPMNVAMVACIRAYGSYITGQLGSMAFQNANSVTITGGTGAFTYLTCAHDPSDGVDPYAVLRWADRATIGGVLGITSSDSECVAVDNTVPNYPNLVVKTNSGNGLVKLANGFVPQNLLSQVPTTYIGTWDASLSTNPPPTAGITNGDMYQVVKAGNVNLHNSAGVVVLQLCNVGDQIVYVQASPAGLPDGWYYNPVAVASSLPATAITVTPSGGISATNVQAALQELDTEKANIASPTFTGVPKAPTPSAASSDTTIATTAMVHAAIAATPAVVADGTYNDIIVSGTGVTWTIGAGKVTGAKTNGEIAKVGVAQNWTKPQRSAPTVDADANFDLAAANNFSCTPTANFTLDFTNLTQSGQTGIIELVNTGNFVASKGANVKCSATMLATIKVTGVYLLSYYCNGTTVYITNSGAMA